jgi:putative molybdopterin biosynthesis protein
MIKTRLQGQGILGPETIPTEKAAGRITAEPVFARYSSPTFHSAAMDGIAVTAETTFTAREGSPVDLVQGKDFAWVNTGNPLPEKADAVIMIEHVHQKDDNTVSIETPAFPWQHVRRIGEDIVATELILPQNHHLNAFDIGALLSGGIWQLPVWEKPRIVVIPTGNEVLDFEHQPEPQPGEVIESNSQVIRILAESLGCIVERIPPVPDDEQHLDQALQKALSSKAHIVIIGAGSSAGSKDFTRQIMEHYGEVLVHGIAAMPGKPSLLGLTPDKTILVGAPGYPVSSVVCFDQLVKPLIARLCHVTPASRPTIPVSLTRKVPSKLGQEEFLRLSIGQVGDTWVATPLPRGAGLITSLTKAQGMATIPASSEGQEPGQPLQAELFVSEEELKDILVCVGSHDNTLDLLANELMGLDHPLTLASTHLGSMGGLLALKNQTAHICGAHLYDPATQDYNFPFLEKYAPEAKVTVINLVIRHQGFIVAKGNPQQIQSMRDLIRDDLHFINRQRGAGTRILLDDHLKQAGIRPEQIQGYNQEEYTHMAVAVNVLSGAADCGMGIFAAAKALDLDFIPVAKERYDLIVPNQFLEDPKILTLRELLNDKAVQKKIENLGGYETMLTGRIMQTGQGLSAD